MIFNEKLKQAKKEFDELAKEHRGFKKQAIPEVITYNKQYRVETKQYPYNDNIKDYILEREKVDEDLIDYLKTEVYLSQHDIREEEKEVHKSKMLAEGWIELNKEAIDKALAEGKKLQVNATADNDWATIKIDKVYKPHIFNGRYGLMNPRARSRGYALEQFDNAFCKLI